MNSFNSFLFFVLILLFVNCQNALKNVKRTTYPVISTLFNNRMLLLLKGTYASDNPLSFDELNGGTGNLYLDEQGEGADPVFDLDGAPKAKDLPIYIDFGEVRIASKYKGPDALDFIQNITESKQFWDFIAIDRQVYCTFPGYTVFDNSCKRHGGITRMEEFFNGFGAKYPSNDPTSEFRGSGFNGTGSQYYHAGVYVRAFVTGYAKENGALKINTRFDNYDVRGSNIVPRNSYPPNTGAEDKRRITPKMFPVFYTVEDGHEDMTIRPGYDPYILEMRMNIKENLMVHSWTTPLGIVQTMVGFSDWRYPHSGESDMGGNLLLRSRVIYPEFASSLEITGGSTTYQHYYAVYRAKEVEYFKQLPLAATPTRNGVSHIKYIHDGDYKLLCLADAQRVDGYPDTVIRELNFSVPKTPRQVIQLDLPCP
ncbi:MAG: hypothetical protein N3A69_02310 [Leptospiraceae bacterium]|nr:hypothetical protein [Leptospiraceae bacterium]